MATELIDASKLDACCTAEANAIRAKTGGSSPIAYDWANSKGFADAISLISGGGISTAEFIKFCEGVTEADIDFSGVTYIRSRLLTAAKIKSGYFPDVTSCGQYLCGNTTITNGCFVFPELTNVPNAMFRQSGSGFHTIDLGPNCTSLATYCFNGASELDLLILRQTSIVSLGNSTTSLAGTKFASDGTGGTIYIPKTLYDHLGDNSVYDYKAASNWSVADGYGTITWAQIEGSYYETHYADGTSIS